MDTKVPHASLRDLNGQEIMFVFRQSTYNSILLIFTMSTGSAWISVA